MTTQTFEQSAKQKTCKQMYRWFTASVPWESLSYPSFTGIVTEAFLTKLIFKQNKISSQIKSGSCETYWINSVALPSSVWFYECMLPLPQANLCRSSNYSDVFCSSLPFVFFWKCFTLMFELNCFPRVCIVEGLLLLLLLIWLNNWFDSFLAQIRDNNFCSFFDLVWFWPKNFKECHLLNLRCWCLCTVS